MPENQFTFEKKPKYMEAWPKKEGWLKRDFPGSQFVSSDSFPVAHRN
jgi:hypothetical protein